ncbi:uncharacterized protein YbcV (DUF1398 family) [Chitinophaga skermanii]|uniref:Uncharacterized protein YbcV (DUF1398 family) n=1 Tax=Chitinophaga skermanii TaxID=331697 RepID=A0A327Q7M9_9BACT|nr:DUF1398 family protein [Chitinophaga skermanii]RAJ00400.1 uncharacterized protein YbcV (DUF1398 family) [Chitinophaga skermanii]
MFSIDQIKIAHSKVESGADFPAYIHAIKALGVAGYETWVKDSHTDYFAANDFSISSGPMYADLSISNTAQPLQFQAYLKLHQEGGSDYYTFCQHCAETGVEKWVVSLEGMTCTYYDKAGNVVLEEKIPG